MDQPFETPHTPSTLTLTQPFASPWKVTFPLSGTVQSGPKKEKKKNIEERYFLFAVKFYLDFTLLGMLVS